MTLPVSGAISFNNINVELGVAGTTQASLGQSSYRTLAGVASGAISMSNFYGKSNRVSISYTFSSNTANATLNLSSISGYAAGTSDITVTINAGVYLYATSTGSYGLNLSGGTSGDALTIVNNGYIMGQGGTGGGWGALNGVSGGPALNLGISSINPTITNTSGYILGGGGGGSGTFHSNGGGNIVVGGGGGAGGGAGGNGFTYATGGGGGGIGSSGGNGQLATSEVGGGGGGRVVLGTGGAGGNGYTPGVGGIGYGGGAGGGGAGMVLAMKYGTSTGGGGGGGGWGASGGRAVSGYYVGGNGGSAGSTGQTPSSGSPTNTAGSGGKGVNLNGRSITWTGGSASSSRVYGAVS